MSDKAKKAAALIACLGLCTTFAVALQYLFG
jgi:hypothetical protein